MTTVEITCLFSAHANPTATIQPHIIITKQVECVTLRLSNIDA